MELIRVISGSGTSWRAACLWLGWGVVGGLLPLWGTALLLMLFGKPLEFIDFIKNGEFLLYAASFIGGGMYTIRRDIFPSKNTLTIVFFSMLAICLLVFVVVTLGTVQNLANLPKISQVALIWISILVFIGSTIFCFLVTLADAAGAGADVPAAMKKDSKSLDKKFETLLRAQGKAKDSDHE